MAGTFRLKGGPGEESRYRVPAQGSLVSPGGLPLQTVSDLTPPGAAVHARDISMLTRQSPPAESLAVMATWAVIFGWLSVRMFKWEHNSHAAAACGAVRASRMGQEARNPDKIDVAS